MGREERMPLLKEHVGDLRYNIPGIAAGLQQVLHPGIGAAVLQQSDFVRDSWGRIERSLPQIGAVIYDRDPAEAGRELRDKHKNRKGRDEQGRRFNALDPETFWWAHATFVKAAQRKIEVYDHRTLTQAEKEQFYKESNIWYGHYDMSKRPVPQDLASFEEKYNDICDNVLEMTPMARVVLDKLIDGTVERRPGIPKLPWAMGLKIPGNEALRIFGIGNIPERVRDRFKIPWSKFDQKRFDAAAFGTQALWPREERMEWPEGLYDPRFAKWAQVQPWEREQSAQVVYAA